MDIKDYSVRENEKPLDVIKSDGGFTSIFHSIACVGDSLSSGEFQFENDDKETIFYDRFEYSWGQCISRMTGAKVYNFSAGGMTAKVYFDHFAPKKGYFDLDKKCQCYIIALSCNDCTKVIKNELEFGSEDDITTDYNNFNKTFVGYYSAIIAKYKEISPYAKFFLVTNPDKDRSKGVPEREKLFDKAREIFYKIADVFDNTYIIDLRKYAPIYDNEFVNNFYLSGHMSPAGYEITAKMIASYIDYIIRANHKDFKDVGMICSEYEKFIKNI